MQPGYTRDTWDLGKFGPNEILPPRKNPGTRCRGERNLCAHKDYTSARKTSARSAQEHRKTKERRSDVPGPRVQVPQPGARNLDLGLTGIRDPSPELSGAHTGPECARVPAQAGPLVPNTVTWACFELTKTTSTCASRETNRPQRDTTCANAKFLLDVAPAAQ